jgi:hypothetical protein
MLLSSLDTHRYVVTWCPIFQPQLRLAAVMVATLAVLCGTTDTGHPAAAGVEVTGRGRAFGCIGKSTTSTVDKEPCRCRDAMDQKLR